MNYFLHLLLNTANGNMAGIVSIGAFLMVLTILGMTNVDYRENWSGMALKDNVVFYRSAMSASNVKEVKRINT